MAFTWVKIANLKGPKGDAGDTTAMNRFDAIEAKNTAQDTRLTNVESKNTSQDTDIANARTNAVADAKTYTDGQVSTDRGRLNLIEQKNTDQDGRLTTVEAKQSVKCVRLESGAWVWDNVAGTHYLIPDIDGSLVVRATAQPVPATTPVLNW